ncbi:Phosphohistidine phosphatase SixA [Bosea sp. CRIB-10]|uniref:histidine phosphatase family protein n=1 Tax=Bosea sp. CRIB-10 TaxID=378404 RepID=UPI0008E9C388|nr:histidine phosphatase family protein [Bosea sp. CRIB-10]SFC99483.1 Phosphohistidine phosphatase SixA [Bosea sp. CRIB-10]
MGVPASLPRRLVLVALATLPLAATGAARESADALWDALATPGHIALLRHADAPGVGDPAGFRIGDCATQRNLGEQGRAQARRIGDEFRRRGVRVGLVLTSQWCRARDTAQLMGLGTVEDAPEALNSFFGRSGEREAATNALRRRLSGLPRDAGTVVMVTHQVNITALTEVFPRSGDIVVLRREPDGGISVRGTIPAP